MPVIDTGPPIGNGGLQREVSGISHSGKQDKKGRLSHLFHLKRKKSAETEPMPRQQLEHSMSHEHHKERDKVERNREKERSERESEMRQRERERREEELAQGTFLGLFPMLQAYLRQNAASEP